MGRIPALTPGVVDPTLSASYLCTTSTRLRRRATKAEKNSVYESYGIPKLKRIFYRLDDLIPLELGGVNTIGNLWPQPILESFKKDRMENKLHKAVCKGSLSLSEAQKYFRESW